MRRMRSMEVKLTPLLLSPAAEIDVGGTVRLPVDLPDQYRIWLAKDNGLYRPIPLFQLASNSYGVALEKIERLELIRSNPTDRIRHKSIFESRTEILAQGAVFQYFGRRIPGNRKTLEVLHNLRRQLGVHVEEERKKPRFHAIADSVLPIPYHKIGGFL